MSGRRRSNEHTAKVKAFQALFWQLETGKKHDITDLNAGLYSIDLISQETLAKSDISVTLSDVKGRLDCKEGVFHDFITILSKTSFGPHLVSTLKSCYEEHLKELTEESDIQYTTPSQVTVYKYI